MSTAGERRCPHCATALEVGYTAFGHDGTINEPMQNGLIPQRISWVRCPACRWSNSYEALAPSALQVGQ